MTDANIVAAVVPVAATTPLIGIEFCQEQAKDFLNLAYWILIGGVLIGATYSGFDIWSKVMAARAPKPTGDPQAAGAIDLGPIKDLIEALTKAPPWFALLVVGLGTLWIASTQIPKMCQPPATKSASPEPKTAAGATGKAADPEAGG